MRYRSGSCVPVPPRVAGARGRRPRRPRPAEPAADDDDGGLEQRRRILRLVAWGRFPRHATSRRIRRRRSRPDRKSTRLDSSHQIISYRVLFLKKKNINHETLNRLLIALLLDV